MSPHDLWVRRCTAFPESEPGTILEDHTGPRTWQRELLPPPERVRSRELWGRDLEPRLRGGVLERAGALLDAALDAQWLRDLEGARGVNELVAACGGTHPRYRAIDLEVIRPSAPLPGALDFSRGSALVDVTSEGGHEVANGQIGKVTPVSSSDTFQSRS